MENTIQLFYKYLGDIKNTHIRYLLPCIFLGLKTCVYLYNKYLKSYKITGKIIVVTGASSGIGLEVSKLIATEKGSTCILIARSKDILEATTKELTLNGHNAYYIVADLSKEEDIKNAIETIYKLTNNKAIDILINCAGAGQWKFIEETSFNDCLNMMSLPYFATFHVTRLLLPKMIVNKKGVVVIVNSPVSYQVWPGCVGYACSRFALRGFTECLRMECAGTGVRVLEVIPGETNSKYFLANGIKEEQFPRLSILLPKLSPTTIAKTLIGAIKTNKKLIITPKLLDILLTLNVLLPHWLKLWLFSSPKSYQRINNYNKLEQTTEGWELNKKK